MTKSELRSHLLKYIETSDTYPPSTRYQEGHLAAMRELLVDYYLTPDEREQYFSNRALPQSCTKRRTVH
ncbi:hypothetical protein ACVIGA_004088 [Bradyrhizobium sp. USDA 3240]